MSQVSYGCGVETPEYNIVSGPKKGMLSRSFMHGGTTNVPS